jgi:hypothetical protein
MEMRLASNWLCCNSLGPGPLPREPTALSRVLLPGCSGSGREQKKKLHWQILVPHCRCGSAMICRTVFGGLDWKCGLDGQHWGLYCFGLLAVVRGGRFPGGLDVTSTATTELFSLQS